MKVVHPRKKKVHARLFVHGLKWFSFKLLHFILLKQVDLPVILLAPFSVFKVTNFVFMALTSQDAKACDQYFIDVG